MKTYTVEAKKYFGGVDRKIGPFSSRKLAEQAAVSIANGSLPFVTIVESVENNNGLFAKILKKDIKNFVFKLINKGE